MKTEDTAILQKARVDLQQVLVQEVIRSLTQNQFEALYVPNRKEALEKVLSMIPAGASVGYGGSWTLDELGIKEILKKGDYRFIDREFPGITAEDLFRVRRESLLSDVFLSSANAVTKDGKLVNVDGIGNRLAGLTFGPKKVIVIAGINKIVEDVDEALKRIKNHVAPLHARRRGWKVPCASTGACKDCRSPDRICGTVLISEYQMDKGRTTIILVGEPLGI